MGTKHKVIFIFIVLVVACKNDIKTICYLKDEILLLSLIIISTVRCSQNSPWQIYISIQPLYKGISLGRRYSKHLKHFHGATDILQDVVFLIILPCFHPRLGVVENGRVLFASE